MLAPLLAHACESRLSPINWFRTDWQRGGAATGSATYNHPVDGQLPAIVKLPVNQRELTWLQRLQSPHISDQLSHTPAPAAHNTTPVPRLLACGESVGGYDLAWVVMEKLPHGPLLRHWHDGHIPRMADAAARFHAAAVQFPVDQPGKKETWDELAAKALDNVKTHALGDSQRWVGALKSFRGRLAAIVAAWAARPCTHWLHGDLHLANAMSRDSLDAGDVVLIDFAEVHAGHWVEDAVYLERQLWASPQRLQASKPVKAIAEARKRHGLSNDSDYPRLAMIRRALLAGTAPAFIRSEGHPAYLSACLGWLEIALNELKDLK